MRAALLFVTLILSTFIFAEPTFTPEEVALHKTGSQGIWVTYHGNVYDITKFVRAHPGGKRILRAAGGPLEPHWKLYPVHNARHVQAILSQYRIGMLADASKTAPSDNIDPFNNEPSRHKDLRVLSKKPFNAESPVATLRQHFITPNALFYKRNHLPVPKVDIKTYQLEIWQEDKKLATYSLEDLKKTFQNKDIVATLQCAGNRRREMSDYKSVKGLSWSNGAISTAEWKGVYLADLLKKHIKDPSQWQHVQFEGMDTNEEGGYGASIPFNHANDAYKEVLLAFEMNHEALPLDHGFPVRVVIPGVVGARNVKWLKKIVVSHSASPSFWQQQDYKIYLDDGKSQAETAKTTQPLQEMPVQSAILYPQPSDKIKAASTLTIEGYAWSGGGRAIERVEVSVDGGKRWQVAKLTKPIEQPANQSWAWTPWQLSVPATELPKGQIEIISRAIDSSQNSQPQMIQSIWNVRGLANNAWYRVAVEVS